MSSYTNVAQDYYKLNITNHFTAVLMLKNYSRVCFYKLGLERRRTDDNSNICSRID